MAVSAAAIEPKRFFRYFGFVIVEERQPVMSGAPVPKARMEKRL